MMFDVLATLIQAKPKGETCGDAGYEKCVAAYANILLPTIFPGTAWGKTQKHYKLLWDKWGYAGSLQAPNTHELFDHPEGFRRHNGPRGMTTWENTVIIGQPYAEPRDGSELVNWLADRGVKVWTRQDLSAWLPGATGLVLAAKALDNTKATQLGFRFVAPRTGT